MKAMIIVITPRYKRGIAAIGKNENLSRVMLIKIFVGIQRRGL
ncbi:hypothetical protein AB4876_13680 [Zhongshania guokunii]|uniref:Uncharacterized protein n=1 Tax=Zhongshania guokunii TaxID=641783 RepID=A0ABV3U7V8_9GAMM